ncbi:uncharacterized protein LOC110461658 [Mizuhopecten yessoensis]|uniref:Uncharacterized protein n=1 Tax=Mizuhopecten yessoensis TaxID=6573 RepID=A0A210PZY9_MIZYE|nr:uncharacterized protein LOC110461658 [Mizuhopecten yessoensis]OWF42038.1 hypothetical protein KP79_PYT13727 [Mizuhopecten yessoensis]
MMNISTKAMQKIGSALTSMIPRMESHSNPPCSFNGERQCEDGSCIQAVDLCPEEQLMNQNTILIMIVVGLAVVIFLIVLYCFQQRQREGNRRPSSMTETNRDEEDHASLYMPPPTYEEVVTTDLYPPTPQMRLARGRITSIEEPPMTPPPNYDAALSILARSHESVFGKIPFMRRKSSCVSRRSFSVDNVNNVELAPPPVSPNVTTITEQDSGSCDKTSIEVITNR